MSNKENSDLNPTSDNFASPKSGIKRQRRMVEQTEREMFSTGVTPDSLLPSLDSLDSLAPELRRHKNHD